MHAVGCRNVKIHLDSYHMNIEENSMQEAVAVCGESLGCAPTMQFGSPCMKQRNVWEFCLIDSTCQNHPGELYSSGAHRHLLSLLNVCPQCTPSVHGKQLTTPLP